MHHAGLLCVWVQCTMGGVLVALLLGVPRLDMGVSWIGGVSDIAVEVCNEGACVVNA